MPQACQPHVHAACSPVPTTSLPAPGAGRVGALGYKEEVTPTAVWLGIWVGDPAPVTTFDGLLHAHAGSLPHFPAVTLHLGSLLCDREECDGDRDREGQTAPMPGTVRTT